MRLAGALLGLALAGCGGAPRPTTLAASVEGLTSAAGEPLPEPARYLARSRGAWVERSASGLDRVIESGRRLELRGAEPVASAPLDPEVEGGAVAPVWAPGAGVAPSRYVFWKGREVHTAAQFTGPLQHLATLPGDVVRAFDWLGGVGLSYRGGTVWLPPEGGAPVPLDPPGTVTAIAVDGRRALALSALGKASFTLDAGATFRDVSAWLEGVSTVRVSGGDLRVTLRDGSERLVGPTGAVSRAPAARDALPGRPLLDEPDCWPGSAPGELGALGPAVTTGIPLSDGGALVAGGGFVGRVDLRTGRAGACVALPREEASSSCAPFRARDSVLLVCAGGGRATLVDLVGPPRVERAFDLGSDTHLDRFVGVDGEALGFVGPCAGRPARAVSDVVSGPSVRAPFSERSAAFCVRAGRDDWVEHRLDPADAAGVIAWIPRADGAAVALVARPGIFLDDRERVSVRGRLRIVRVASSEPPLAIAREGYGPPVLLSRAFAVAADDTIEGWLSSLTGSSRSGAVTIDPEGRVRSFPLPARAGALHTAGRFGMTSASGGRLFETTDRGRSWRAARPPPSPLATLEACSPVGCRIGPFARVGWSGSGPAAEGEDLDGEALANVLRSRRAVLPAPPALVRLTCSFDAPPRGARRSDSFAFGLTSTAVPRSQPMPRLGGIGVAVPPVQSGSSVPGPGELELAWVPPLDLMAPLRRARVPVSLADATRLRAAELHLALVLEAPGGLSALAAGAGGSCFAGALSAARVTRPGACAPDPAVGVDVGGRTYLASAGRDALVLLVGEAPAGARGLVGQIPGFRELHATPLSETSRGLLFGVGVRGGSPVVVTVDAAGSAALAPVDPERGTLGAEERLRPLTELELSSSSPCAAPGGSDEARVLLPFDAQLGLDRAALPGLTRSDRAGVAVLRWSHDRACLDAAEIPVVDERYEADASEGRIVLAKIVARFVEVTPPVAPRLPRGEAPPSPPFVVRPPPKGAGVATLVEVGYGSELRQRLVCTALLSSKAPAARR